jgi:GNAT superfamily N-acetyltransferase
MMNQFKNQDATKVVIRFADASDAHWLATSRYDFRSSLDTVNENRDEFLRRCSLWMHERLQEQSLWRCWVAEQDQTLIGNLWLQRIEKIPNPVVEPEYHAYITNVYVAEAARGQGIGSMLLSTALAWAKAQDLHAIILWPTEKSRSLYARHGFSVREDLFALNMDEIDEQQ